MADEVDGVADVEDGLGGEQLVAVQLDPVLGRRVFRMPAVTPTHRPHTLSRWSSSHERESATPLPHYAGSANKNKNNAAKYRPSCLR